MLFRHAMPLFLPAFAIFFTLHASAAVAAFAAYRRRFMPPCR